MKKPSLVSVYTIVGLFFAFLIPLFLLFVFRSISSDPQGFNMKTDTIRDSEEDTILSSLFDQKGMLIARLAQDKTFIGRINIFSNTLLTYLGISVGSSLSDLLKAYSNVAIITGERGSQSVPARWKEYPSS